MTVKTSRILDAHEGLFSLIESPPGVNNICQKPDFDNLLLGVSWWNQCNTIKTLEQAVKYVQSYQ